MGGPDDKKQPIKAKVSSSTDGRRGFPGTRWSLVVAAGGGQTKPEGRAALESLCRAYGPGVCGLSRRIKDVHKPVKNVGGPPTDSVGEQPRLN